MDREIKFRAWDKKTESMVEVMNLDYFTNSGCTKQSPSHLFVHKYYVSFNGETDTLQYDDISERFELMQYTGLKDKNGTEIYEGDIIQIDWNDTRYPTVTDVVEWNNELCCFEFQGGNAKNHFEVIGNKFLNPELIK